MVEQEQEVTSTDTTVNSVTPNPNNLAEWYTAQEAAKALDTSKKYVLTLAVQYSKFPYHKLSEHTMLYWKPGVDAYKINKGQAGRPRGAPDKNPRTRRTKS